MKPLNIIENIVLDNKNTLSNYGFSNVFSNLAVESRISPDPVRYERMTTDEIRKNFLVENLFTADSIPVVYSDVDRVVIASAVPVKRSLLLDCPPQLAAKYFAQRREIGIINIGGSGKVAVDGKLYELANRDCLYISRGQKEIVFLSDSPETPAKFYIISYPAHTEYPTTLIHQKDATAVELGNERNCNVRTIYKYIYPNGIKSCQLVMGLTELACGSVWNTMPVHTHARRTEVYMYFDLDKNADCVFHYMGKPDITRQVVVRNEQIVISPSWSIHAGVGTRNYTFIWAMGGENQDFDDMDGVKMSDLK
jgi:4-deoxy-L-threo-5-hexosulose-uronate ketol-isomerase